MTPITTEQYFGPYAGHPAITPQVEEAAAALLYLVNDLRELAAKDGCEFPDNPATGCGISGYGNGGFRPPECKVGAPNSTHKKAEGIDNYDPQRQFASWCLAHPMELAKRGLHMEDPRWTPSWVHLQSVPPKSGRIVYVPSLAPALAKAPEEWRALA
jgi:hypothetical protein